MSNGLIIACAGGMGRDVADFRQIWGPMRNTEPELVGFIDDGWFGSRAPGLRLPILSTIRDYEPRANEMVIAVAGYPEDRKKVTELLNCLTKSLGYHGHRPPAAAQRPPERVRVHFDSGL